MVICPYCNTQAELLTGEELYPFHPHLAQKHFYNCTPCDSRVGCHPPMDSKYGGIGDGTVPMGTMANAELRRARQAAHDALDPMFRSNVMSRQSAYVWLAREMGLRFHDTHIAMFTLEQCARAVTLVAAHPLAKKFAVGSDNRYRL